MNDYPETPFEAYKQIIDRLVEDSAPILDSRVRQNIGIVGGPDIHPDANLFFSSLSHTQREVLASLLTKAHRSAVHDVLAELTWWIMTREVGLTYRGQPMPVDLSGMGLHGDYIGRLDDWPWPSGPEAE